MASLSPAGHSDVVYTPRPWARAIVDHFKPSGYMLDPCRGQGAFYDELERRTSAHVKWCEIDDGVDFLTLDMTGFDWIVTNPPWGRKFYDFLIHSMELANNIVFLANRNVWDTKCRLGAIRDAGFGIVEHLDCPTPPPPWPQAGFQLAATWLRRGWTGSTTTSTLTKEQIDSFQ